MFDRPGWNRLETTPPVQHSLEVVIIIIFFIVPPFYSQKSVKQVTRKRVSFFLLAKECHFLS